jgi:hypothetical protein
VLSETFATVGVPTATKGATGGATFSYVNVTNIPCSIQPGSASEVQRYGGGLVHESDRLFIGYFPTLTQAGAALNIKASARVIADGVTYYATAPGQWFADGVQIVPLVVKA